MPKRWSVSFLFLILMISQPIFAADYSIGSADLTLRDASRKRDVPLKIYFPKTNEAERFPVLVFSHGAGGSKDGYAYLGKYWAEHGYIVLHPTHLGSDRSLLKRLRPLYNLRAVKKMVEDKSNLLNRPGDVTFLLNSLPQLEEQVPALKGHLDPTRIGVGGHSFGAYTSMAVAGAKIYSAWCDPCNFEDTRVRAFIALSPQGPGGWAFKEDSWDPIRRPMFMMSGTQDKGMENGKSYQWRVEGFYHLRPGHKFLAVIEGANHMDFSDTQFNGKIRDPKVHDWIDQASLFFWDAYVKGDRDIQQKLINGEFPKVKGVRVKADSK